MDKIITGEDELYLAPEKNEKSTAVSGTEITDTGNLTLKEKSTGKNVRVREISELRNKNRKVYLMSDGRNQAVFTPGDTEIIDNKTAKYIGNGKALIMDDDGRHFRSQSSKFTAKFSCEEHNDELFSVEQGMHRITVLAKKNKRNSNKGVLPKLKKADSGEISDTLLFENAEKCTDIEYTVTNAGVKENIVIKEEAAAYRYPFILHCENVTYEFDETAKRVSFLSNESGEEIFFISTPFMKDANGIISNDVSYEVKSLENDNIQISVTADNEWINDKHRAFPIIIDPQIMVSGSSYFNTYSWDDGYLYSTGTHTIGTVANTVGYENNTPCDNGECTPGIMSNAIPLAFDTWVNGCISYSGDEIWYQFTADRTGSFTMCTQGSLDTMGYLCDSYCNYIAQDDDSGGKLNFSITAELRQGERYYLRVRAYSNRTGTFSVMVSNNNCGSSGGTLTPILCYSSHRMYMDFTMPELPGNPRIKNATITFYQENGVCANGRYPKVGLYRVTDPIYTGCSTPNNSAELIDFDRIKSGHYDNGGVISYTFDITQLIDEINKNEPSASPRLVLKLLDETEENNNHITVYGSTHSIYAPVITINYESSYGVNTSYRTHTHEIGRFGQGSIDLACGNLMFESEDFAWAGNRMPVTIRHLFNSALSGYQYSKNDSIKLPAADFSAMKIGDGFRLNIMQSVTACSDGYIYIGDNGDEIYLTNCETIVTWGDVCQCYNPYDYTYHYIYKDKNGDIVYDPEKRTMSHGSETYLFDTSGRLIKITDENGNSISITYTSNRITSVNDGAGREFAFTYSGNYLTSITAPDGSTIGYSYTGDLLSCITYPGGKKACISWNGNKPSDITLSDADDNAVYKVAYTFNGSRVSSVTEYGVSQNTFVKGSTSSYEYSAASRRTVVQTTEQADTSEGELTDNVIKTVYTFDNDGNVVSEYVYSEDTGNVGADGEESGINPHSGDGGAGIVSNINNLLKGHNFEDLNNWAGVPKYCHDIVSQSGEAIAKYGKRALTISNGFSYCTENGVYQVTNILPAGKYTFSVYARVENTFYGTADPGVYIRVTDTSNKVFAVSEHLCNADTEYTRLIAPFELDTAQSVKVEILLDGSGTVHVDAAQLENNPYANAYNMLENGNFENSTGWQMSGAYYTTGTRFNMSRSLRINGELDSQKNASQLVYVRTGSSVRETFTLSGWAKGYGIVSRERNNCSLPTFRLRAVIYYKDYGSDEFTADFSPCTEEWQFASVQFAKLQNREVSHIRVYCDYDYNVGSVYFDDIQLVRNSIETGLSASDFVTESTDSSDGYEPTDTAENSAPDFRERRDKFGNTTTETTFTDGEFGTVYRSFAFNNTGNDLISETDARGNTTSYAVDEDASRNEEVTDRLGNKTAYEYDGAGRTTKVTSKKADETELANVSYAYDSFDNMTEIVRGDGMKYVLAYNAYHNLESIGIDGKPESLISYTYKNGNGRLKELTYANGDRMKAAYNSIGQMVSETWYNSENVVKARYKYTYDGEGNIVRSIDIHAKKEYNYTYEEGKIARAVEYNIDLRDDIVISKDTVNTVSYVYNSEGRLIRKIVTPAYGDAQTIYYETDDDKTVVRFSAAGRTVTSHSKSDSFGRKVFDELQLETGFVSRQFTYHTGKVTQEHKGSCKLKSTATTQLVSRIVYSDNRTISYEYDAEERITKVTDSVDGVTEYTYDALGQLLTETFNGTVVNTMTYDNYGNIVSKNGKAYTYGSTVWEDLLTSYDGQSITYDAQGNPTSYLGHTLTWEKGRQLKSFDGNTYTYNANGIRTSKTVDGVKHTYILDGTKILRETWGYNTLIPLYDNEDSVCGILYNNVPYYFVKNLQGDVIAITDKDAQTVARYSYDAWGTCTSAITNTELTCGDDIAIINPFRYRCYYFDDEIGLYYLQSRYYDANIGRFVNGDNPLIAFLVDSFSFNLYAYCDNSIVNDFDYSGFASFRTKSNTLNKLIEALEKSIPNIYTQDFWCKEKQLLRIGTTNLAITISCGIAAQSNKNALFGGMFRKGVLEVSAFFGINNYVCFSFSAGITLRKAYLKVGLLLAMSKGRTGFYGGAYVEISVPTWLLAVATVAVGVACVYNPAVGAYIAKLIGSMRSGARVAAAALVPIFPYIVKAAA